MNAFIKSFEDWSVKLIEVFFRILLMNYAKLIDFFKSYNFF